MVELIKTESGAPATAGAANDKGVQYLKLTSDAYKGTDHETGEFLNLIRGDVARVSAPKATQLLKDFPKEWKKSDKAEYEKAAEDRSRRSRELEQEIKAREKRQAIDDRDREKDEEEEEGQ